MMMMMMMISQGPWFPTGREDLEAGTTSQNLHCGLQPNRCRNGYYIFIIRNRTVSTAKNTTETET